MPDLCPAAPKIAFNSRWVESKYQGPDGFVRLETEADFDGRSDELEENLCRARNDKNVPAQTFWLRQIEHHVARWTTFRERQVIAHRGPARWWRRPNLFQRRPGRSPQKIRIFEAKRFANRPRSR